MACFLLASSGLPNLTELLMECQIWTTKGHYNTVYHYTEAGGHIHVSMNWVNIG